MTQRLKKEEWEAFLEELKEALRRMGIAYRETARIRSPGALCTVFGNKVLIVNRTLHPADKADLVRREVSGEDLERLFLKPGVREYLGG
jgi:murein endopeptidase